MRFYAPTNVFIEKNCVANHKKELLALGTRAFLVTGRHSSKKNGSLADVTGVLEEAGVPYQTFYEIEENPSVETVVKAAEAGKAFGADFVVGIGGGSPLDAAKAIALLIANPEETGGCLYTPKDLKPLPIACVPTTCGTGSEVTPNAVLTRHEFQTKKSISYNIYPDLALVDGKYLESASDSLILNTALDALAHCVESRLHAKQNSYNHMFSERGLILWGEVKSFLAGLPGARQAMDADALSEMYEKLMLLSTVAGMAIAQTGTSLPHAFSYELTYHQGVPHGKACAVFLAAYLCVYVSHKPGDVAVVLRRTGFDAIPEFGDFLESLLGRITVTPQEMETYIKHMTENTGKLATFPFPIGEDGVRRIFAESLEIER